MSSDMLVALGNATADRSSLFAHNSNRVRGERPWLTLVPGRDHVPGEQVPPTHPNVPEVRHTWGVLAGRAGSSRGYPYGVNEKGVAIGCAPIATRMLPAGGVLTGQELVQLGLERAATACQAVEVVTDLICRHGQGGGSTAQTLDAVLLIADAGEAYVLEAAGHHWAMAQVGKVRAVASTCMLRQDWDRISRGLSSQAIERGWWPGDGCKLDFATAVGRIAPDHAASMYRWGKATVALEQHVGTIDLALVRRTLREQAELVCPCAGPPGEVETAASFLVQLGLEPADLPLAWCALGSPASSVYLPFFPVAELPAALGEGGALWRDLTDLAERARQDSGLRRELRPALIDLQERLDEHAHDFIEEARSLHRRGMPDELRRLAGSFMHYCGERADEMLRSLRHEPAKKSAPVEPVLQGANF